MIQELAFFLLTALFAVRRRIDSFAIAGLGIFVYYFPIFTDLTMKLNSSSFPTGSLNPAPDELKNMILLIYSFLLISSEILKTRNRTTTLSVFNDTSFTRIATLLALVTSILAIPIAVQYSGKISRMESIGYLNPLYQYSFSLAILLNLHSYSKNLKKSSLILALYFSIVSIGVFQIRYVVMFPVLAALISPLYGQKLTQKKTIKHSITAILVVPAILSGKAIVSALSSDKAISSLEILISTFKSLEPFSISSRLVEVFKLSETNLYLSQILKILTPFLHADQSYHQFMKTHLYPTATYGLGGNPLGELYLNFGYVGSLILAVYLVMKCYILDYIAKKTQGCAQTFSYFMMFILLLYTHRNSFVDDVMYARNFLILFLSLLFANSLINNYKLFKERRQINV